MLFRSHRFRTLLMISLVVGGSLFAAGVACAAQFYLPARSHAFAGPDRRDYSASDPNRRPLIPLRIYAKVEESGRYLRLQDTLGDQDLIGWAKKSDLVAWNSRHGIRPNETNIQSGVTIPIFCDERAVARFLQDGVTNYCVEFNYDVLQSLKRYNINAENMVFPVTAKKDVEFTDPEFGVPENREYLQARMPYTTDASPMIMTGNLNDTTAFVRTNVGKVDLVLVLDKTGSMSDEIEAVRDEIQDLIGEFDDFCDFRVNIITYADDNLETSGLIEASQATQMLADIAREVEGESEYLLDALYEAGSTLWRNASRRLIIVVGDEQHENGSDNDGTTRGISNVRAGLDFSQVITYLEPKFQGTVSFYGMSVDMDDTGTTLHNQLETLFNLGSRSVMDLGISRSNVFAGGKNIHLDSDSGGISVFRSSLRSELQTILDGVRGEVQGSIADGNVRLDPNMENFDDYRRTVQAFENVWGTDAPIRDVLIDAEDSTIEHVVLIDRDEIGLVLNIINQAETMLEQIKSSPRDNRTEKANAIRQVIDGMFESLLGRKGGTRFNDPLWEVWMNGMSDRSESLLNFDEDDIRKLQPRQIDALLTSLQTAEQFFIRQKQVSRKKYFWVPLRFLP